MITIDRLNMISRHKTDRRLHELSGLRIECPYSSWSLGSYRTRMEASASKDTPLSQQQSPTHSFPFPYGLSSSTSSFFLVFGVRAHNCFCLSYVFDSNELGSNSTITL